jgi:ABC-type glycerol-3-phosphate transport system permease component
VLKSPEHYTLQVGLNAMLGSFSANYRYVAAGAIIAIIPVVIVFVAMQRAFMRGILSGAVKG